MRGQRYVRVGASQTDPCVCVPRTCNKTILKVAEGAVPWLVAGLDGVP